MPRKILLIDDDRLEFRLAQAHFKAFRGESYELDWANTYEDGLQKLLAGGYAACLLDYQLGPRSGLQLIREAVTAGCTTPIVFLTADSSPQVDTEAMNAGAMDFLVKGEIGPASLERSLRYAHKLGETLETLRRLATHDALTGLLNRREFERRLGAEEERARSGERPLALFMIDVDRFKTINDTHGHPAGDAVLREVSARLQASVPASAVVGRFGGDEFALILPETDLEGAVAVAERIRQGMHHVPISTGGETRAGITLSIGGAVLGSRAPGDLSLVAEADKELYRAKAGGRDRASLGLAGT